MSGLVLLFQSTFRLFDQDMNFPSKITPSGNVEDFLRINLSEKVFSFKKLITLTKMLAKL